MTCIHNLVNNNYLEVNLKKITELKGLTLLPKDKLIIAMRRLNKDSTMFQLIVSNDGKLLGTLTDGDIRRSIIEGKTAESTVMECMKKNPSKGKLSSPNDYKRLFNSVSSLIKFLPVVNHNNILKFILIEEYIKNYKSALIMAGGFGKRLGKKTKYIPKPLLKIGDKTVLENLLQKLEKENFNKIYISTFYLYQKIVGFVKNRKSKSIIKILIEDKPLGTAGCISLLDDEDKELVMVINADIVSDIDFNSISIFHNEKLNDITIPVSKYSHQIPFGVINFDKELNYKNLKEKPILDYFVMSGIYFLSRKVCDLVKNEAIDMPDLIERGHLLNFKIGIFPIYEYWKDIGSIEDLNKVRAKIKNIDFAK